MSQTAIGITTHPPETNRGTVTSYLPVPSWSSVAGCSAEIYSDVLFVALNPFYGQDILKTITCLPQAATLWWQQSGGPHTTTELGPLICPDLYTTASTSALNAYTTFVACCPRDYTFNKLVPVYNVGECNSPLSQGQTVSFMTNVNNVWIPGTTTITAAGSSVSGVHMNGYVFAPSPTSTSAILGAIGASSPIPPSATNTSDISTIPISSSASTTPLPNKEGMAMGTKIVLGVGIPLAVLGICCLFVAGFLLRRTRKLRLWMKNTPIEDPGLKPELDATGVSVRVPGIYG